MKTQTRIESELVLSPDLSRIVRELPADLDTPVTVYLKLAGSSPSFLLESITGGEQLARYSFIGIDPARVFVINQGVLEEHTLCCNGRVIEPVRIESGQDQWDALRDIFKLHQSAHQTGLPRFTGGLVGYIGYEMMRFFEPTVRLDPHPDMPDAILMLADIVVAFDHAFGKILLIGNASPNGMTGPTIDEINERLDQIEKLLKKPLTLPQSRSSPGEIDPVPQANMTQSQFENIVEIAKEHIAAGDIFQAVLSQRFDRETTVHPFNIYRALRRLNPSPYMFYFDFGDLACGEPMQLIGASPEVHVRLEDGVATVRPIAGTRKRGKTPQEEFELEQELLSDPKERAEHVMLVDLGRNDLGRICEYGSVKVTEAFVIERYSHVMHIVSHIEGCLKKDYDGFDLLRSTFPAGTVSGAPKIRAMQIINELEPEGRGPYAGAVGYFSFDGSMDTCISIRTLVQRGNRVSMQAGAGIVADSVPEYEYQETLKKLGALMAAIDLAEDEEN